MSVMTLTVAADVKINEKTFPDSNFRDWVLSQEYGADDVLTNEEMETIDSLNISRLEIHNLKGIEYFTALKVLNCMTNKLTSLDLSKNTALEKLVCNGNRMTTINLLENKELRYLNCVGNSLTALDVSGCTELDTLACSANQLTALDVSNNTNLISLECYGNQLTSLDLSKNTALRRVHCNNNQLTTLNVSKNTALTLLQCSNNLLTTLDVMKNSVLRSLSCMNNKLTTLYVSDNKSLNSLSCFNNQLTSLDVSGCSALKTLGCYDNQLTTINLSGCSALDYVNCNCNQLTTLDLSENTALTTLFCLQNQIKGIGMDALVESLPIVSEGSLLVMNFENEQNVMTTTQVAAAKAKGWTPYIWTYGREEYAGSETTQNEYRPFIEAGKLWVVNVCVDGFPDIEPWKEYYYFDGYTMVDGKRCEAMWKINNATEENWVNGVFTPADSPQEYLGAWYEKDRKVYLKRSSRNYLELIYDFTLCSNDTIDPSGGYPLVVNRVSGGIPGFKGTYYEFWHDDLMVNRWLEGVGSDSWPYPWGLEGTGIEGSLLYCCVGDEVIYYNSAVEDPYDMNAPKRRFDFTHTTKSQPKIPKRRSEAEQSLYGEYNNLLLDINLDPLSEAYLVRITDETGKVVYEKAINAGSIVALNIDISAYAAGRYTVTVENSQESFTGEFETQTTGIRDALRLNNNEEIKNKIYNLQGQRLSSLQRGLNIVNGQKVYVK